MSFDGTAGAWSYRTGPWFAAFGPRVAVLLPESQRGHVIGVWSLVDGGAAFDEVLDALLASGLSKLPGFVLVSTDEGPTRVLLRGAGVSATLSAGGEDVTLDGSASGTWVERTIDDVTTLTVLLAEPDPEDTEAQRDFGIVTGLVRVSRIDRPPYVEPVAAADEAPDDASVVPTPVDEVEDVPTEEAPSEEVRSEEVPSEEVPSEEVPPGDLAAASLDEPAPFDEPAPSEEPAPLDPPPLGDPLTDPMPPTPAPSDWVTPWDSPPPVPAVDEVPAPDEQPAADEAPAAEDGPATEVMDMSGELAPESTPVNPLSAPTPETEYAPPAFAPPPPPIDAPSVDLPPPPLGIGSWEPIGGAVPPPPPAPPAPAFEQSSDAGGTGTTGSDAVAKLMISDGQQLLVDGVILIGRAPEARRFDTTEQPTLITVPSRLHEISSTHIEIRPGSGADQGAAVVTDMGSTNGTVLVQPGLQPEDLKPGIAVQLQPGAIINLGDGITIQVTRP